MMFCATDSFSKSLIDENCIKGQNKEMLKLYQEVNL